MDWPPPTTVCQVSPFLGFVGYYRRFIPAFARVVAPLHGLTHGAKQLALKTQPVKWDSSCQKAFEALKSKLVSAPILVYAILNLPFRLLAIWLAQRLSVLQHRFY